MTGHNSSAKFKSQVTQTHGSLGLGGTRAFPLKKSVICLIDVASVSVSTTFPVNKAGSTSTPVPFRYSWSLATWMSKLMWDFSLSFPKEDCEDMSSGATKGVEDEAACWDERDREWKAACRADTRWSSCPCVGVTTADWAAEALEVGCVVAAALASRARGDENGMLCLCFLTCYNGDRIRAQEMLLSPKEG